MRKLEIRLNYWNTQDDESDGATLFWLRVHLALIKSFVRTLYLFDLIILEIELYYLKIGLDDGVGFLKWISNHLDIFQFSQIPIYF